jgi:hypothetical protein
MKKIPAELRRDLILDELELVIGDIYDEKKAIERLQAEIAMIEAEEG